MAFRGYLQRQFHALTGGIGWAIVLQALVFGIAHGYQGWRNVIVISVLGVLFGVLAAWRKNLRANMIVHAWADIWEGWLKFVVWRLAKAAVADRWPRTVSGRTCRRWRVRFEKSRPSGAKAPRSFWLSSARVNPRPDTNPINQRNSSAASGAVW